MKLPAAWGFDSKKMTMTNILNIGSLSYIDISQKLKNLSITDVSRKNIVLYSTNGHPFNKKFSHVLALDSHPS